MKKFVVGIDEVGRGALAGPLAVGAVMATQSALRKFSAIKESKQLSPKKREEWSEKILASCGDNLKCAIAYIPAADIDAHGMAAALKKAVADSLVLVGADPDECKVLLDGALKAPSKFTQESIIKGDEKKSIIAMASVIAKVARDRDMVALHAKYPEWGFDSHKGYGTEVHCVNIKSKGLSALHRVSFCSGIIRDK
jgi:ribonuclease HII